MTSAQELAARLRADGTTLSIEAAEWLEATQEWLAQENAGKASALTVCAHCWGPFTNDEVRSHVQSCPSNPLVKEIEKLRAAVERVDYLQGRLLEQADEIDRLQTTTKPHFLHGVVVKQKGADNAD